MYIVGFRDSLCDVIFAHAPSADRQCNGKFNVHCVKDFGRCHRFPAQSLSDSGSFCAMCIEYMLHFA